MCVCVSRLVHSNRVTTEPTPEHWKQNTNSRTPKGDNHRKPNAEGRKLKAENRKKKLPRFWPASDPVLTRFGPISDTFLAHVWPVSDPFLTCFCPVSDFPIQLAQSSDQAIPSTAWIWKAPTLEWSKNVKNVSRWSTQNVSCNGAHFQATQRFLEASRLRSVRDVYVVFVILTTCKSAGFQQKGWITKSQF